MVWGRCPENENTGDVSSHQIVLRAGRESARTIPAAQSTARTWLSVLFRSLIHEIIGNMGVVHTTEIVLQRFQTVEKPANFALAKEASQEFDCVP
jgi:hypothetical protein